MLLAALPGVLLGIAAGVSSSRISGTIMRVMDLLMSFPPLLLAVAVPRHWGPGRAASSSRSAWCTSRASCASRAAWRSR
jgi:ABC-type dipeptide/oligopeptide/nickel transport system permease subunit